MRNRPPQELVELLGRLGLATASQVDAMENRVRRLARDLPWFESIWIDALSQARLLTPYQTAEINAGRGEQLHVGRYTVRQPARPATYAECYQAVRTETKEIVRLMVYARAGARDRQILNDFENLAATGQRLDRSSIPMIEDFGLDGDRVWAASPWHAGTHASDWMLNHGRFPPAAVLAIGRSLASDLASIESIGVCHGDVGMPSLWLLGDGSSVLLQPGLRGIIRPEEGLSQADLPAEAYDSLAPERIATGVPPTISSDLYSFGCLMSHLLCGRSPLGGGDSMTRLRAARTGVKPDFDRWVREVPDVLAQAIAACLDLDPGKRPESFARLAAALGPPTRSGRQTVARCLARSADPAAPWIRPSKQASRAKSLPYRLTATVAGVMVLGAIAWPIWVSMTRPRSSSPGVIAASKRPKGDSDGVSRTLPGNVPSGPTHVDHTVAQAGFESSGSPRVNLAVVPEQTTGESEIVVPSDRAISGGMLAFKPGQWIHAEAGRRARIVVPPEGLPIDANGLRFENIDFIASEGRDEAAAEHASPAILRLQVSEVEFRACTFETPTSMPGAAPAIVWTSPTHGAVAASLLPAGRIKIRNCMFRRVGVAIDARTSGALAIEINNTLHLGPGPLIRLDHCPQADEPVRIVLSQATLRNAGGLLVCSCGKLEDPAGEISIEAAGCVLAPTAGSALVTIESPDSPDSLVRSLRWSGQGSLITPTSTIASWQRSDGARDTLDDSTISIAGLVRGAVEFAGAADSGPAANRAVSWQAPLQSADSPGADVVFPITLTTRPRIGDPQPSHAGAAGDHRP